MSHRLALPAAPQPRALIPEYAIERWAAIPGFRGSYEASTHGRIRSLDRVIVDRNGRQKRMQGKVLSPGSGDYGRENVQLGKGKGDRVHALVLLTFLHACPPGLQCAHQDGDASNNHLCNLSWKTPRGNTDDKFIHGTTSKGEAHGRSKLTSQQVADLRRKHHSGISSRLLAAEYNIHERHVRQISSGKKVWKHLSSVQQEDDKRLHLLALGDMTLSIAEWSRVTGIKYSTLRSRIRIGWTAQAALEVSISSAPSPLPKP
jgi:hypothetical protein